MAKICKKECCVKFNRQYLSAFTEFAKTYLPNHYQEMQHVNTKPIHSLMYNVYDILYTSYCVEYTVYITHKRAVLIYTYFTMLSNSDFSFIEV